MWRLEHKRETKRGERDAKRGQREARAEQADHVAAWHERGNERGADALPVWGAQVRNGSKLPVYDLTVEYIDAEGTVRESLVLPILPPGEDFIRPPVDPDGPTTTTLWFRVAIEFRDTADRIWRRDQWGRLDQVGRQVRITPFGGETGGFNVLHEPPETSERTDPDE